MIIDAHHHFWQYTPAEYGWIDQTMSPLRRDFGPADLRAQAKAAGVDGVVSVQARQTLQETHRLLQLARENPDLIRGVVGWAPLAAADVGGVLEELASDPLLRAVRHVVQDEPDDRFLLRDDFNRGIALLEPLGLRYDLLLFERHLPVAIEFVDRHPNTVFVLDHIAKPRIKAGEQEPWRSNLRELSRRRNVYCKLSGMVTEADWKNWTPQALRPYFEAALQAFGPHRLMFGSDWPNCTLASGYGQWLDTVRQWIGQLSPAEQAAVLGGTAIEAYDLKDLGMNTLILEKPGELRLASAADLSARDLPPGHALVRVRRVGICGTDWHAYRGRQPFFTYPRVLGHELGVVVEAVNDPASTLCPGDTCAVEPYLNCGSCIACRRGKSNCCANLRVLGVHVDGGMCERLIVPAAKLHPSKKLSLDQLALVETLGIGCHAVDRAQLQGDEQVLVVGAGPIGLSVVPFVRAAGANPIMLDVSESRLAFCQQHMGVQQTINGNNGDVLAALQQLTGGDLPTAVLDATGNPQSMMSAFNHVAPGGRIVFVGLFQGDVTFNDPNFHRREVTLHGSRNALPKDFRRIIALVEDGVVDTTPWITHRSPAEQLPQQLPAWLAPEAGVIKAVVEF